MDDKRQSKIDLIKYNLHDPGNRSILLHLQDLSDSNQIHL